MSSALASEASEEEEEKAVEVVKGAFFPDSCVEEDVVMNETTPLIPDLRKITMQYAARMKKREWRLTGLFRKPCGLVRFHGKDMNVFANAVPLYLGKWFSDEEIRKCLKSWKRELSAYMHFPFKASRVWQCGRLVYILRHLPAFLRAFEDINVLESRVCE